MVERARVVRTGGPRHQHFAGQRYTQPQCDPVQRVQRRRLPSPLHSLNCLPEGSPSTETASACSCQMRERYRIARMPGDGEFQIREHSSWAVSHAEGCVIPLIRSVFTSAIYDSPLTGVSLRAAPKSPLDPRRGSDHSDRSESRSLLPLLNGKSRRHSPRDVHAFANLQP